MSFKKCFGVIILGFFIIQPCFSGTLNWQKAQTGLSPSDGITAMTTYHQHVYIAGYNNNNPSPNCSFLYSMQSLNQWISVSNGLQASCPRDLHDFVTFNDQLYVGGLSGFYVYNGDDTHPNWTALSVSGLPTPSPTITNFAVFNNKLYAVATRGDGVNLGVYVYDESHTNWNLINGSIVTQRVAGPPSSLIVFNNKLYWFYNYVDYPSGNFHGTVYVYNGNDTAPSWSTVYQSQDNREIFAFDVMDNTLYMAGTIQNPQPNGNGFVFAYNGDDASPQWIDISDSQGQFNGFYIYTLQDFNHNLYVGGINKYFRSRIYQFNGDSKTPLWTRADNGISPYIGPGYSTGIQLFAVSKDTFYTAQSVMSYPKFDINGSNVYASTTSKTKPQKNIRRNDVKGI